MSKAALASIDYFDAASSQSSTITVHAAIARLPSGGRFGPKGHVPIQWCYCVHDSPENPCPCTGPIIWIRDILLGARGKPGRIGEHGGKPVDLVTLHLDEGERVFLDISIKAGPKSSAAAFVRTAAGSLSRSKDEVLVPRFMRVPVAAVAKMAEVSAGQAPPPGALARKKTGNAAADALIWAFGVGWGIGEIIDEGTGLSDSLADWLYDTLGPWDDLF